MILPIGIIAWFNLLFTPAGFYVAGCLTLLCWLAGVIYAAVLARRTGATPRRRVQRWYFYVLFVICSALLSELLLQNRGNLFGYETFRIPSASMADTLQVGDFVIARTWHYRHNDPQRGDLLVFNYPPDPSIKYIKRVIGLPGDNIVINNNRVFINGKEYAEPYLKPANNTGLYPRDGRFVVPADSWFVLGDNRDNSRDSRYWGYLSREHLFGRVEFIWISYSNGVLWERVGLIPQ